MKPKIACLAAMGLLLAVTMAAPAAALTWSFETVAATPPDEFLTVFPGPNSMALDSTGMPHVTYYEFSYLLKYARKTCTKIGTMGAYTLVVCTWSTETVDPDADVTGNKPSLVLDASDRPHIAYTAKDGNVKYARKGAGGWAIETVGVGSSESLKLDSSGFPHLSYMSGGLLKYAKKQCLPKKAGGWGVCVPVWSIETVADSPGIIWVWAYSSLALDFSGLPHISFRRLSDDQLKYARKLTSGEWTIETADFAEGTGGVSSLALDASDTPTSATTTSRGSHRGSSGTRPRLRPGSGASRLSRQAG